MHNKRKCFVMFALTIMVAHAQDNVQDNSPEQEDALKASKDITWEANRELQEDQFVTAEANYRRAISKSGKNAAAPYNLGNALYEKESYKEAFGGFKKAGETATEKDARHSAYHNMGNVFMKNKEYEKAVEAYKEALRNDPTDEETRYNLALAKEMLKKQQNEEENNDDKENQDQQDQKEQNKDQQNQDQDNQQQNQDQKKDEGKQGENEKEENKNGDGEEKQEKQNQPQPDPNEQQQAPRPNQLSPQQIQNLLEAMQNEEKKVQEKLDATKVKGVPTKSKKDW